MTIDYSGKTALISGAAGGIGLALAKQYGNLGMNIVMADIDKSALTTASEALKASGINVLACELDVTVLSQWQNVVDQAMAKFGSLYMLVNNAGVGGVPYTCYKTEVELEPEGLPAINVFVLFIDSRGVLSLLGQEGFFDRHIITFDRAEDSFEVISKVTSDADQE